MRRFMAILLALFVFSGLIFAQDETAACYFEEDDESYIELGYYVFGECAELLIEYGYDYEYWEAYGWWGEIYTYVGETGEVYYYDYENEEWVYWATVDVPYDESTGDDETGSSSVLSLDEIFELAEYDINVFWEMEFDEADLRFDEPDVVFAYGEMDSECGRWDIGPFYCGADNTVYLELNFMEDQYYRIGDYAVVIIMAHEWGHAVEQQLGYFDGNYYTITTELMADCFAGAYTNYLINESENAVLEAGDVEEAMSSLFESGDAEGVPWFDETAHGTGEQRMDAFQVGTEFGVEQCFEVETP